MDLEAFVRHHLKREVPESALDAATAAVMRNANGSYTYAIAVLDDPGRMDCRHSRRHVCVGSSRRVN